MGEHRQKGVVLVTYTFPNPEDGGRTRSHQHVRDVRKTSIRRPGLTLMMIYGSQVLRVVRTVMLPSTRSSVHSKFCKRDISPGQRGRAVVAGTHEPDVAGGR